ncbi:hypothetical protein [Mycoplasmopsis arginini]|uniref:hypothetical protein n=1 Tax=Mycoplasmopsis arginini TaxID=2094 RepID=UPI00249E5CD2|nr:hypothetical protein [Mycoplasmopsis arginini]
MGFIIEFIFTLNENKYFEIKEELREKNDWSKSIYEKARSNYINFIVDNVYEYHICDLMSKYHSARLNLKKAMKIC